MYIVGKSLGPTYGRPVRNKRGPYAQWYISREVWAPDEYPMWFQGLVYFLSPQNTGQLFTTALNTHYMHTDDVFMGILVNKTREFSTGELLPLQGLSISETVTTHIQGAWTSASYIFYHVPEIELFHTWYLQDNL